MAQKKPPIPGVTTSALTHSPFAKLVDNTQLLAGLAKSPASPIASRPQPAKPLPPCRVRMRMETKGRSGKVVTRISGLPPENLGAIASRLRKGLGCGASIEDGDVLLQGSLAERAAEWFDRAGDLRAIKAVDEPATPPSPATAPGGPVTSGVRPAPEREGSSRLPSATTRSEVRRGQRVAVVLKADQLSGRLTQGIVAELLTNSPTHPRGIKVRLESGEVGRVKIIY